MPRSVNAVASRARRKKVLKQTKGNYGARKNVWTVAKNTYEKGLQYAYRDRKAKKRSFRSLWIQRINAAARIEGMSYSQLMGGLKKANIEIDRKALAYLGVEHPEAFKAVVATAKDALAGKAPVKKAEAKKPVAKKAPAKKAVAKKDDAKVTTKAAAKPATKAAAKKAPAKKAAPKKAAPKSESKDSKE